MGSLAETALTIAGTAVVTLIGAWKGYPKLRAQAAMTVQAAENAVWGRWQNEIARLETIISRQGRELEDFRERMRTAFNVELELRATVGRQKERMDRDRVRIAALESKLESLLPASGEGIAHVYSGAAEEMRALPAPDLGRDDDAE